MSVAGSHLLRADMSSLIRAIFKEFTFRARAHFLKMIFQGL